MEVTPTYRFCFWSTVDTAQYASLCELVTRDEVSIKLIGANICGMCRLNLLKVLDSSKFQLVNQLATHPQMKIFHQKFDKSRPCEVLDVITDDTIVPQHDNSYESPITQCNRCYTIASSDLRNMSLGDLRNMWVEITNPFKNTKHKYCRACHEEKINLMKCHICEYTYQDFVVRGTATKGWTMTATGRKFCPGCSAIEDCGECNEQIATGDSMVVERNSGRVWCGKCFVKNFHRIDGCLVKLTKQVIKDI